ncbi:unnamed protein product [Rotaria sp. Silwood2]|nr:unnamed protein product [Rotaria sp. Silwood2]
MYVEIFLLVKYKLLAFFRTNTHPLIKWSQTKDHIILTIAVQDIDKPDINIEQTKFHFKGQQTKGSSYDTTFEFFDAIDPNASKYRKIGQNHWEFMLKKKDPSKPFWKRLIKSIEKCSWITVDWNHFAGEDDDNDNETGGTGGKDWGNIDALLKNMGGDVSGADAPGLNDTDDKGTDSDDEPMPDLEDVPKTNDEQDKSATPTN